MNMKKMMQACAAAAVLAAAGGALGADAYTAITVPTLPGGTGSIGYGVNNAGTVVGQADNAAAQLVAFVYSAGVIEELPLLTGGSDASAASINTAGVIVGTCRDTGGVSRAVKWEKIGGAWTIVDLGTLDVNNAGLGVATRINDNGVIVGYATVSSPGPYRACVWSGAVKMDLGTLNYAGNLAYSQALGINSAGEVTGYAYAVLQGPEHGMVHNGDRSEDITPPERFGLAQWHNINDGGTMIGYVSGPVATSGAFRPATHIRGEGTTLLPLIDELPEGYAYDINNGGVSVGTNFQLNPVPEPNVFKAFKNERGATDDLNLITTGLPGIMTEARDVSDTGFIIGTAESGAGPVAVLLTPVEEPPQCPGDFDGQNGVTIDDLFLYINAWFTSDPAADFDGQNGVGIDDLFLYINAWFVGC